MKRGSVIRGPSAALLESRTTIAQGVGEMAEWLKAHAWKACLLERVTWVRIPLSPPASLNCRETPPPFLPKTAKHAHLSRYLPGKPDWRERTAQDEVPSTCLLFSGGHMRGPVSTRASGECSAITSQGFSHSELTFVSTLEPALSASQTSVYRY